MSWREFLGLAALILSIVNGLMLLRHYLRDKAELKVRPVHPDVYQWWFRLPAHKYQGNPTREYGFLAYVTVVNHGLRKVSLDSWNLFIDTPASGEYELKPLNIPEPKVELGESGHVKALPVLGQRGLFSGETMIDSGDKISGMAYYVAFFWGDGDWNPQIVEGKIKGKFVIKNAFRKKTSCTIVFSEISLEKATSMIPGIEKIR